jgi:hypothetical protein
MFSRTLVVEWPLPTSQPTRFDVPAGVIYYKTLAMMHGSSCTGDCARALDDLKVAFREVFGRQKWLGCGGGLDPGRCVVSALPP